MARPSGCGRTWGKRGGCDGRSAVVPASAVGRLGTRGGRRSVARRRRHARVRRRVGFHEDVRAARAPREGRRRRGRRGHRHRLHRAPRGRVRRRWEPAQVRRRRAAAPVRRRRARAARGERRDRHAAPTARSGKDRHDCRSRHAADVGGRAQRPVRVLPRRRVAPRAPARRTRGDDDRGDGGRRVGRRGDRERGDGRRACARAARRADRSGHSHPSQRAPRAERAAGRARRPSRFRSRAVPADRGCATTSRPGAASPSTAR